MAKKLHSQMVDIAIRARDAHEKYSKKFPIEEMWKSLLDSPAYQLSLWSSQRVCYLALYNGYEAFLVQCVKTARHTDDCRTTDRDFNDKLRDSFGEDVANKAWTSSAMNLIRLVRHSLVHAGGKLTKKLERQHHSIKILDNRLQIVPADAKALVSILAPAVESVVQAALDRSEFGTT